MKHFSKANNQEVVPRVANMTCKVWSKGEWIIDSGCTEHITFLPGLLESKKNVPFDSPVVIPNGKSVPIEERGDCMLPGGKSE